MSNLARFGLIAAVVVASVAAAALLLGGPSSTEVQAAQAASGEAAGQLVIDGKTIPVLSFSAGVSNPATIGTPGGGGGAGKASFSSLNVNTLTDETTPVLYAAVATGKHFPDAVLTGTWGTGNSSATFTYELDDVFVESVQQSGGGDDAPFVSLSLAFGKVTWTYTDAAGTVTRGFDIVSNTPTP
jgi:type VI secretion system secreted protein Hcp